MPTNESFSIYSRPGDSSGVGVLNMRGDASGLLVNEPTQFKNGTYILHKRKIIVLDVLAATPVDNGIFIPTDGVWVLDKASSTRRVVAAGVTGDVMVCASGVAPASGVTQLTSANSILFSAPAADIIANHALATTLTECGPGSYFALHLAGTLTGLVAKLTLEFKRIR